MFGVILVFVIFGVILVGLLMVFTNLHYRFPRAAFLWIIAMLALFAFWGMKGAKITEIILLIMAIIATMMTISDYFEFKPPPKKTP